MYDQKKKCTETNATVFQWKKLEHLSMSTLIRIVRAVRLQVRCANVSDGDVFSEYLIKTGNRSLFC